MAERLVESMAKFVWGFLKSFLLKILRYFIIKIKHIDRKKEKLKSKYILIYAFKKDILCIYFSARRVLNADAGKRMGK